MDPESQRATAYIEDRKLYVDMEREASRLRDQAMISVSTGSLALSLTFMRGIGMEQSGPLLLLAWVGFGIAIMATVGGFSTSEKAAARQREILDEYFKANENLHLENKWNVYTNRLNRAAELSLAVGLVLLISFVHVNLHGGNMADDAKTSIDDGPTTAPAVNQSPPAPADGNPTSRPAAESQPPQGEGWLFKGAQAPPISLLVTTSPLESQPSAPPAAVVVSIVVTEPSVTVSVTSESSPTSSAPSADASPLPTTSSLADGMCQRI